jgi:hypothetical protein
VQVVDPVAAAYWPARQLSQAHDTTAPTMDEYDPAAQLEQLVEPAAVAYLPATQSAQALRPDDAVILPTEHEVQAVAPDSAYVPTEHEVQAEDAVLPVVEAYFPATQAVHPRSAPVVDCPSIEGSTTVRREEEEK